MRNFNLIKLLLEVNSSSLIPQTRSPIKAWALKIDINILSQKHKWSSIWLLLLLIYLTFAQKIMVHIYKYD